jgi:hypothetical protein
MTTTCSKCGWTNVNLLNFGNQQIVCRGCCKRALEAVELLDEPVAWIAIFDGCNADAEFVWADKERADKWAAVRSRVEIAPLYLKQEKAAPLEQAAVETAPQEQAAVETAPLGPVNIQAWKELKMPSCEKCWRDSDGNPDRYAELVEQRNCTPEEQAGEHAGVCYICARRTRHQYCYTCMNPTCVANTWR